MKVRLYPSLGWAELGATRFVVEWYTVRPEAVGKDEIEPDVDVERHMKGFETADAAWVFARATVASGGTAYGDASVTKQQVDWFVKEDRVAEWVDVGEEEWVV